MTYDTSNCHRSGDIDDLSYEFTTLEGFTCSLISKSQGLHVCKTKNGRDVNIFRSNITDNTTIFGGTCCELTEGEDQPEHHTEEVSYDVTEMTKEYVDTQVTGLSGENNSTINVSNNR